MSNRKYFLNVNPGKIFRNFDRSQQRPYFRILLPLSLIIILLISSAGILQQHDFSATGTACENLVISKAIASSNEIGNTPANVIDNNVASRWSNEGSGSWITLDLANQKNLCGVDISWYKGNERKNSFILSASQDGTSFTNIYNGISSGSTAKPERYTLPNTIRAQYLKITVNGNTVNDWASITEIDVSGYVITSDITRPQITINSPSNDQKITTTSSTTITTISVSGTVFDSLSGVNKVEVRTDITSYQLAAPKARGDWSSWTSNITLAIPGAYSIVARATDNAGNQEWQTINITVGPLDKFNIKKLYETITNGREWFAKWDSNPRVLEWGWDPYDPEFDVHGNIDYLKIDGHGTAIVSGDNPRFYIHDRKDEKTWQNVEITYYAKLIGESNDISYDAFTAGARTGWANSSDNCNGFGYYGIMRFDGSAVFQKELINHVAYSTIKPYPWVTPWQNDGPLPKNQWIGIKYILRNMEGGSAVKMELYIDRTDGRNGGTWEKIVEYVDDGNWSASNVPWSSNKYTWVDCGDDRQKDWMITNAYPSVMLRTDYVAAAEYKKFSVREISPLQ